MKIFRKLLFWTHLIAGLIAGLVILVMSATGALLAFAPQITDFAESDAKYVEAGSSSKLKAKDLLNKVLDAKSNMNPASLTIYGDPQKAAVVSRGRGKGSIYVNPYNGEIIGETSKSVRGAFRFITGLHRWFALEGENRAAARAITGACNLAFMFLAISGIYIWFPKKWNWRSYKAALTFRWKVKGKARDFNWHTTIGFWSSLVLLVLTSTATVFYYNWAKSLVYIVTGNEPPSARSRSRPPRKKVDEKKKGKFKVAENLNELWSKAEKQAENPKYVSLRLPIKKEASFTIDEGKSWNIFGRSRLKLNSETGEVVEWKPYRGLNSAQKLRSWIRFTHTGESFGFIGQIIAFLGCVSGIFLVYTGISLSVRRFSRWINRRNIAKS